MRATVKAAVKSNDVDSGRRPKFRHSLRATNAPLTIQVKVTIRLHRGQQTRKDNGWEQGPRNRTMHKESVTLLLCALKRQNGDHPRRWPLCSAVIIGTHCTSHLNYTERRVEPVCPQIMRISALNRTSSCLHLTSPFFTYAKKPKPYLAPSNAQDSNKRKPLTYDGADVLAGPNGPPRQKHTHTNTHSHVHARTNMCSHSAQMARRQIHAHVKQRRGNSWGNLIVRLIYAPQDKLQIGNVRETAPSSPRHRQARTAARLACSPHTPTHPHTHTRPRSSLQTSKPRSDRDREKPYRCPHCDYAGTQSASLKYHLERHHRERQNGSASSGQSTGHNSSNDHKDDHGKNSGGIFARPDVLRNVFKGMPPNLDFRGGPLLPHQWGSAGMMSPHDRERIERHFDSSAENMKSADGPSPLVSSENPASFSDLSRAYQSMIGNGVHFQGSLQAFMDNFVLSSMKKDHKDSSIQLPAQRYHDNGEPKAKRASIEQDREEKIDGKPNSQPGKPGSQYEPLDLSVSVRPESASGSIPGASLTIHDNVAWHGCLFCSFSTPSLELMALHLQANHLGKGHPQRSEGREASPTMITKNIFDKDDDGEKGLGGWNNHMDQPYNPFQSDFYRRFGGLYDGSPKSNQGLQGYGPLAEDSDLPNQGFPTGEEEMGDRGSSGGVEDPRSDEEGAKTPKRRLQNHSDDELEDGRGMTEEDGDRNENGQMEEEEERSPRSDHLQNHNKHDGGGSLGA
ncbi:hypothetical protein WMY93_013199 [Mugilogobius chulae]|uniref:C2H2-type domain-containing protein n=1 Tax=Mugilogobius chulae TaxID=88201 RepID=A0AAW0NZB4_9GOBI